MTEEDRKKYRIIVSRKWKEIREDPARLSVYNDRPRQMKNEAGKTTKLGDDSLVSRTKQHEKTMAERSAAKQPHKAPKTQEFVNTDLDDSRTCGKMASKKPGVCLCRPKYFIVTTCSKTSPKTTQNVRE